MKAGIAFAGGVAVGLLARKPLKFVGGVVLWGLAVALFLVLLAVA